MIHYSPEARTALEMLKDFIRENAPLDALDERALALAGLPEGEINEGIACVCRELAELFAEEGWLPNLQVGLTIATGELVRDRIAALQARGIGHS